MYFRHVVRYCRYFIEVFETTLTKHGHVAEVASSVRSSLSSQLRGFDYVSPSVRKMIPEKQSTCHDVPTGELHISDGIRVVC